MLTDAEKLAFRAVLAELDERKPDAMDQIWLVTREIGFAAVVELVERAKKVHAEGGMLRKDGQRRTLGGVWFQLVHDQLGHERFREITGTRWRRLKNRRKRWAAQDAERAAAELEKTG
jgi:hypothetical protein